MNHPICFGSTSPSTGISPKTLFLPTRYISDIILMPAEASNSVGTTYERASLISDPLHRRN